jgi:DNA-binding CsgD family transcriptional regulator
MSRRRIVHQGSASNGGPSCPCNLVALESDDGSFAVLSFTLPDRAARARLSPAEAEVVRLVLAGQTNRSIATLRGTTPRTVANQIASIFRKLGVSSRLELAVKAPLVCVSE